MWSRGLTLLLVALLLMSQMGTTARATLYSMRNFAVVTASTGYDSVATTVILSGGDGAKLPNPGTEGDFFLVWWNATDYGAASSDPNREILRVTARSTDTLTVVRGQDGTTAVNHNTAGKTYRLQLAFIKAMYDKIGTDIAAATGAIPNVYDCSSYASCNAALSTLGSVNLYTLRASNSQSIASNLIVTQNVLFWREGAGQLDIATSVTASFDRPDQIKADSRVQLFKGAGSVAGVSFAKPGTVYPKWWGAACDATTDDGPEIQSAHNSLPAAGGIIDLRGCGTYKVNQEIAITKSDVTVLMGSDTVLNISSIAGSGTTGVHSSDTVLAAFKVTGSRVRIIGGRITGTATVGGKQTVGVLIGNTSSVRVGATQIDHLFACVWAYGNAVAPVFQNLDCGTNSHGVQLGSWSTAVSSPQVTRPVLMNVYSHEATVGSGVNCGSFTYDLQLLGGELALNAGHGINLYPGCQRSMIAHPWVHHNTLSGLSNVYSTLTGLSAGKLGVSSGVTLDGGQYDSNGESNVAIYLPDYSTFSSVGGVEEVVITGVQSYSASQYCFRLGVVRSAIKGNIARSCVFDGFVLHSSSDASLHGNQSWDHGSGGDNRTAYLFNTSPTTGSTPPDNTRLDVTGNHGGDTRSGGSRTVNFAANLSKITASHVQANIMQNANNTDWTNMTGHTALYLSQNSGTGTIGQAYTFHFSASTTWDPASLTTNSETSTTMTVSGAAVGDRALCGHTQVTADLLQLTAIVSATNTVRVILENISAGTIDVSSGTLTCEVWQ